MKRAMKKVDTSGGYFSFSDARSPDQLTMLDRCDDERLGEHLCDRLAGRDTTVREVEEYVLVSTPLVKCRFVLADLERAGRISIASAPPARRKNSFNHDSMIVRFPPVLPGTA